MPRKSKDELKNSIKTEKISEIKENKNITKSSTKSTSKSTVSAKKKVNKTADEEKANSKKNVVQIKATNKNTVKKTISKKGTKASISSETEYYDLPYRYNETVVKILAQTPTTLFIYWDISDSDKASYIQKYGENFFNKTKPILKITNNTLNYSFEVEINDFANSWYLHVNDANCNYSVELGRRLIYDNSNIDNYIHVIESNNMETPNNHILFEKLGNSIFFKNVKNNFTKEVPVSSISYIKRLGKFYNVYELYKEIYKNDINIENLNSNNIKLDLSSSNSSTFM